MNSPDRHTFDVLVVGAGPAGLNAALVLGRMRRRVLVLDTDSPAHAVSDAVHGFLSHDGTPPRELRRLGRAQLQPYTTVEFSDMAALAAHRPSNGTFELQLADGGRVTGRRLLLAHGMHYGLPDIPGVAELWGTKVFHCPYCHGWEVRDRRLAVHGCGEKAVHQALLLTSLSKDVVLCAGTAMTADHVRRLGAAGIDVRTEHIERVEEAEHGLRVVLQEHPPIERDALFIQPKLALPNDLARSLGADITDTGSVMVDATGESRIPGLFVAGDAGTAVQSVAVATGSGARAAYAINAALATNTETRTSEV